MTVDPRYLQRIVCYIQATAAAAGIALCLWSAPALAQDPIVAEDCPAPKHRLHRHHAQHPKYPDDAFGEWGAAAAIEFHRVQQRNGEVLDRTVWNHQFEKGSAELRPSGQALLKRLTRRIPPGMPVEVFIASAGDMRGEQPLTADGDIDEEADAPPLMFHANSAKQYLAARESLDAARVLAVTTYLQIVLKRPQVEVYLHDPAPTGLFAQEASEAYQHLIGGSVGHLPYGTLNGQPIGREPGAPGGHTGDGATGGGPALGGDR